MFAGRGSCVVDDTEAVLDRAPVAVGLTWATIENTAGGELADTLEVVEHVTVPFEPGATDGGLGQVQPVGGVTDTNVRPGGSGSVIVASAAGDGPALATEIP